MDKSNHSDQETGNEELSLEIPNDSVNIVESTPKRLREETLDDKDLELPCKKVCTSVSENDKDVPEINGEIKDTGNNVKVSNHKEDTNLQLLSKKNVDEESDETSNDQAEVEVKNESFNGNHDENECKEQTEDNLTKKQQKEDIGSKESGINTDKEDLITDEEKDKSIEEKDSNIQEKETRKVETEVVEGLELSVECASDKEESSSSESEDEKDKKPKTKTIIVKAKPNDSELDVSSSEEEKSDSQDTLEVQTSKQTDKKGRRKGRTSFTKTKSTDSEENDDISDEDYSPRTKKKLKKMATNKKSSKSSVESKKGRGRAKNMNKKLIENKDEENDDDNTDDKTSNKRTEGDVTDTESEEMKNESESGSEIEDENENENGPKEQRKNTSSQSDKKIEILKKYIRTAGIRVKSYNDLWAGCKSNAAKIKCLKKLLEDNGITGRPTLEKCRKARKRNETLKDIAELNMSNIISEGRVTRARRGKDSNRESSETQETPTKREARSRFKKIFSVVDSDSE